jgi:uncharacterized protein YciI
MSGDGAAFEFDRFELVLLRRPSDRAEIPEEEAERRHDEGHLVVAGPFDEQSDESLRGLCLYQTGSLERARELAGEDPAVRAGRFECEVMFFYCKKGVIADPHEAT